MSNLFRKKSLERISSPEQLNEYVRVSTPSVWLVLKLSMAAAIWTSSSAPTEPIPTPSWWKRASAMIP